MATSSTYYLNGPSLGSSTAVFLDSALSILAPDGFYSDGVNSREQVGGVLLPQQVCTDCNAAPVCPNRRVVIQICNSNGVIDDNFDIYLNDNYIGAVDLNSPDPIGSLFIADLNPAVTVTSSDFACPLVGMVVYHFDPAFVLGYNTLEMRNTQNNGSGNGGQIGIRNYLLTGTSLATPCVITNLNYNGGSGVNFLFNFNYTACCEGD